MSWNFTLEAMGSHCKSLRGGVACSDLNCWERTLAVAWTKEGRLLIVSRSWVSACSTVWKCFLEHLSLPSGVSLVSLTLSPITTSPFEQMVKTFWVMIVALSQQTVCFSCFQAPFWALSLVISKDEDLRWS